MLHPLSWYSPGLFFCHRKYHETKSSMLFFLAWLEFLFRTLHRNWHHEAISRWPYLQEIRRFSLCYSHGHTYLTKLTIDVYDLWCFIPFFYILQKFANSFSFSKVYRTHHVWLLTFPWKCFYSFMISSPYLPNWSPNYIYSVTNIKWKEETPGKRDQFTFWGRNMCKKWRKFLGIVSFAAHLSFWPQIDFQKYLAKLQWAF